MKLKTAIDKARLMSMRSVLTGTKIYLDDDLTILQQEHKREGLKQAMATREQGKWAVYRDGKVIIREKIDKGEKIAVDKENAEL